MAIPLHTDEVFPPPAAQIGLAWNNTKTLMFRNIMRETESGNDVVSIQRVFPKWLWNFQYKKLDESAPVTNQLRALAGFFLSRRGRYQTFLIQDTEDYRVPPHNVGLTRQVIGFADGATTQFQAVRYYGNVALPIEKFSTLQVFVNGSNVSNWDIDDFGVITFTSAPVSGLIEITGHFYHRVRFDLDEMQLEQFMVDLWNAQSVVLRSAPRS